MARILAIGDIHGCYIALQTLCSLVNVRPEDTLITLGDYTGKGPDSRKVLDWLLLMQGYGNLVALCGNHEVMLMNARKNKTTHDKWLNTGGWTTLRSYAAQGERQGTLEDIPDAHWHFLDHHLKPIYVTAHYFFVHATVAPDLPLDAQPESYLFWNKFKRSINHYSGKVMVCGHTSQKTGLPDSYDQSICIDTKPYHKNGWLSCLDVKANLLYQANQDGQTRQFRLGGFWNTPRLPLRFGVRGGLTQQVPALV
nr:metallophosphoesterase family protein [uncultured Desulfobulbus sp.]